MRRRRTGRGEPGGNLEAESGIFGPAGRMALPAMATLVVVTFTAVSLGGQTDDRSDVGVASLLVAVVIAISAFIGAVAWLAWTIDRDRRVLRAGTGVLIAGSLIGLIRLLPVVVDRPSLDVDGAVAVAGGAALGVLASVLVPRQRWAGVAGAFLGAATCSLLAAAFPAGHARISLAAWVLVCGATLVRGWHGRDWLHSWLAVVMWGWALSTGMLGSSLSPTDSWAVGARLIELIALVVAGLGVLHGLTRAYADQQLALDDVEARGLALHSRQRAYEELVHDARSASLAIEHSARCIVERAGGADAELASAARIVAIESSRLRRTLGGRGGAGTRPEHDFAEFDVATALTPLVAARRLMGWEIDVRIDDDLVVYGSSDWTASVLQNLIDNAHHHGEGEVRVRCQRIGDYAAIDVEHGGLGLSAPLEELITRGVSGASDPRRKGLGLHIARTLLDEQGGELSAESLTAGGTRFRAKLPTARTLRKLGDEVLVAAT